MSKKSPNLGLYEYEYTDKPDLVKGVSDNMEIIDKEVAGKAPQTIADQIQKNTAQIETAGKATSSHAVGEYVLIDNVLYKVTTAVAANDAWTINENIQAVNLGGEIASLNNNLTSSVYIQVKKGKSLGGGLSSAQANKISTGDFYGLNIGDYWTSGGHNYRIAGINWYLNRGDTQFTRNHLVIVPDDCLLKSNGSSTHYMNATDIVTGGYNGSAYRSTYRSQAKKYFTDVFGTGHIATYRGLLSTSATGTSNGAAGGWDWKDCDVECMTEAMVYGSHYWSSSKDTNGAGYNGASFFTQLPLFMIAPEFITNRENYWLQDIASNGSAAWFAFCAYGGYASRGGASDAGVGLRPFALLV